MANIRHGAAAHLKDDDDVVRASAASASRSTNAAFSGAVLGTLLDCDAPYLAIGIVKLRQMSHLLAPHWSGPLMPVLEAVASRKYWHYGRNNHASDIRAILGSVVLHAVMNDGTSAAITHFVLEESSQWGVERNVTSRGGVPKNGEHCLVILADG